MVIENRYTYLVSGSKKEFERQKPMKYRIRSKARASDVGPNEQLVSKTIQIDVELEFDHEPSDEEIQNKIEEHPKYVKYILQFVDIFRKDRID